MITGSGGPKYNAYRSGPGVLIESKNQKILVDMGNGTFANLNRLGVKVKDINTFMFTHHHLDHNEEFIPIFIKRIISDDSPITIIGPEKTKELVDFILSWYEKDINYRLKRLGKTMVDRRNNIIVKDIKGGDSFDISGIKVTTTQVNHTITTIAYRYQSGKKSIVVSGDLTYSPSLAKLAKNTDILIMDSGPLITSKRRCRNRDNNKIGFNNRKVNKNSKKRRKSPAHPSIDDVMKMATDSNSKQLVLTHIVRGKIDESAVKNYIGKSYRGRIILANDLLIIE